MMDGSKMTPRRASRKSAISTSISGLNTLPRMVFCGWCWSWTARSSSAAIRISACCTVAPKS
jgi:hypothetical protein